MNQVIQIYLFIIIFHSNDHVNNFTSYYSCNTYYKEYIYSNNKLCSQCLVFLFSNPPPPFFAVFFRSLFSSWQQFSLILTENEIFKSYSFGKQKKTLKLDEYSWCW